MKTFTIKKKYSVIAISVLVCCFIIFVSIELFSIKKSIEQKHHIMVKDGSGENIFTEKEIKSAREIPSMISTYINKEEKIKTLPSMLFPNHYLKQVETGLLTSTIYSQNELLTIFVNNVYFDYGIVGMSTASAYYLNKSLDKTSKVEQFYLLAKMEQKKTGNIQEDSQNFLKNLLKKGYLSKEEYTQSTAEMDSLIQSLKGPHTYAQSYVEQTLWEAEKSLEISESELIRSGYTINTNLNKKIQQTLYTQFENKENFPLQENPQLESGMVILDHHTGKVLGLMGGREYQKNALNRASQITRQPASTFKPLIVYAPAIELGWKPTSILKDVPIRVGGYKPHNFDFLYRKEVSLQDTVAHSYNVPTVWLLYKIGLDTGLNYIKKFDLFDIDEKDGYKLALGFSSKGTSPLALAQAYTIFPNGGNMVTAHTINSIRDNKGKLIYKNNVEHKRIIKKHTADEMNALLRNVVTNGTANKADLEGEFVAGKTGTTSYDGWFVGYTKKYTAAVWIGPDAVDPDHKLILNEGSGGPTTLFHNVIKRLK
ncbi:penicillin-binding protein 1A [Neobacillus bataviensis LMG 21833]|uniref:Penicillin-binding protein 1A n=1 Tax=Neobacillus bataviensis LMG 21833 TaxID=1117379 RepID=K6DSI8_9BACI|nr:penicillin-binding transpeptidase domain-containing protein [Neobacillus bataviensis]EKN71324.1 penicillin-binding protein 1A [Neobacillus bataviensis LMG 21833]